MILPIVAYGDRVLKNPSKEIEEDYPDLKELIDNMFDTMYNAKGVGLAAPQIGKNIRLFIVDASPFAEDEPELDDFKKVFINPIVLGEDGKPWKFNEGCLSIPGIREDILRKKTISIEYFDENFNLSEETFDGHAARIIQHEYDHIEGILFTDKVNPFKKTLLKKKLSEIAKGHVDVPYRMKFPLVKHQ